jgi:hypothetical protein
MPASALRILTGVFGVVWLANAAFQAEAWLLVSSARANFLHALAKPATKVPAWIRPMLLGIDRGIQAVGPEWVAGFMVAIALGLGLALLMRVRVAAAARFGIAYSLICWVVLDGFGFPYRNGQTDPGVFIAYAIAFLFVLAVASVLQGGQGGQEPAQQASAGGLWRAARLSFGALWLFDAALKWLPAFLLHFRSQITSVIAGQPHWVAVWLGFIADAVTLVGPVLVAVLVGLVETLIAAGLLTGRWLRVIIPIGFAYSLSVWASAEAFGGPYTAAGTGVRGNVLGNVLIYLIPFVFLWIAERSPRHD